MLDNVTRLQLVSLWICLVATVIYILIDESWGIIAGIIFLYLFFGIEVWNNAKEKQQLKIRVKELESSANKPNFT